jgi:hypothetical protein
MPTPRATCGALAALLLTAACRSQPAPEARAPEPASPVAQAAHAVDPCAPVWRAAQVDVVLRETPEPTMDSGPLRTRRFTVARQRRGDYRYRDQWASVLEYQADGVSGALNYTLVVPDVLADLSGRALRWEGYREPVDCLGGDGQHPALLAGDTLRDEAGRLLVFTSPSLPVVPGGTVRLPPGLGFQVRWEDAGCAVAPDAPSRGVRLLVRGQDGVPVPVPVGTTRTVALADGRYEVRVASAQADTRGHCGQAVLALYRLGLREQLPSP